MQPKIAAVTAGRRNWVRMVGGAMGAILLLAVPALAMSFVDLKALSQPVPETDPTLTASAFQPTSPVGKDGARLLGTGVTSQNSTVALDDWSYTHHESKVKATKTRTKTKTRTRVTRTKSPHHQHRRCDCFCN